MIKSKAFNILAQDNFSLKCFDSFILYPFKSLRDNFTWVFFKHKLCSNSKRNYTVDFTCQKKC